MNAQQNINTMTNEVLQRLANKHDNYIPFHAAYDALGFDNVGDFHAALLQLSREDICELRTYVHDEDVNHELTLAQKFGTPLYFIVMTTTPATTEATAAPVKAPAKKATTTAPMTLTYRQLQQALKALREAGQDVQVKLNSKTEVLQAEYNRLTGSSVTAPVKAPTPAQTNGVSYRQLQTALKGKTDIKLNSKYEVLYAEFIRINDSI